MVKKLESAIKVLMMMSLVCVLALSFSPSKTLAATASFDSFDNLTIVDNLAFPLGEKRCTGFSTQLKASTSTNRETLFKSKCCGGEVRVELEVTPTFKRNGIDFLGETRLFEGGSCDTDKLEDHKDVELSIKFGQKRNYYIDLYDSAGEAYGNVQFSAEG